MNDLLNALAQRNQDLAGGRLRGEAGEPLTRTVGRFRDAQEIGNLSLEVSSGNNQDANLARRRIYLRDVAEVIDGTAEQRVFVSLNGELAVKVSVYKQPDANTIAVIDGVKKRLAFLRQSGTIPEDMTLVTTRDESVLIRNSIANVMSAGASGTILAALAVFLFLGSLRQTLIIVLAIPLATLAAIILMKLFGLSINVFSLGGLALGVGIVVDNSIVMLENIALRVGSQWSGDSPQSDNGRFLTIDSIRDRETRGQGDKGTRGQGGVQFRGNLEMQDAPKDKETYLPTNFPLVSPSSPASSASPAPPSPPPSPSSPHSPLKMAEQGSQEVESALIASTTTNLVAVLPFLLIGGLFSLLFKELILTISFAVAASLLLALTVVPMLASRLLAIKWSSGTGNFWLVRSFNTQFKAVTGNYTRLLRKVLRYRLLVIALAFLLLGGGSWWMADQIPQEILPRINTGQARLFARFPPGITLATNRQVMKAVDGIILEQPETEYAFTATGGFIFGSSTIENLLRSSSSITLKPGSDIEAFVERVSEEFKQLNLVNIRLSIFPERVRGLILNNSPARADIDLIIQGKEKKTLEQTGRQLLKVLDERVTLARFRPDADSQQPEIQIRPDWERLATLGLTTEDLGKTIETAIQGAVPTQLQRDERLVDVRVQLDERSRQRISQLEQLPLFVDNNNSIRLGDVATLEKGQAPGEIQRINQRQVFLIVGSLTEGANLSDALAEVETVLADLELPEGVSLLPSYAAQSNRQLQTSLKLLGSLAVFLVFVVMAVQYNSLIDPLVIILTVPLALAGGIFGLYITQTAIGATVLVGAILLVGIVVNNAIVMVELANQLQQKYGMSRQMAIFKAASQRLRPILMTAITTVLGLFPLALGIGQGSEFLQPLGVVVFSGLSLATFLTLFIIPCF